MDLGYVIVPFMAWVAAGSTKFAINSIKAGRLAFDLIGYGGLPSTHSAIVSSAAALVAIREGVNHPAFGVALALAFIVILDAGSLRRQIGRHAQVINRLNEEKEKESLRERMGHSWLEICCGILVGILTAWFVDRFFAFAV